MTDPKAACAVPIRIHYAWYILAASVIIELFGLGFGIFAITTVYPYIIDTFPDWSRSTVFLPTSVIILIVGAMSPLTGYLIDRYPIRLFFVAGSVLQGLALYLFFRPGVSQGARLRPGHGRRLQEPPVRRLSLRAAAVRLAGRLGRQAQPALPQVLLIAAGYPLLFVYGSYDVPQAWLALFAWLAVFGLPRHLMQKRPGTAGGYPAAADA